MTDIFDCMTLGQIIEGLDCCPPDSSVRFGFCYYRPGSFHSYRGFYEDLAITPTRDDITVSDFLKACNDADCKTFTGWKGGDYRMGRDTRVWVDETGSATSTGIVGIENLSWGVVILKTEHIDV